MTRILSKAKWIAVMGVGLFIAQQSNAQYNGGESGVGLRAGGSAGITYKKFFNKSFAFETIVANNFEKDYDGMMWSATLQKHVPLAGYKFSALLGAGPAYHFKRGKMGVNPVIGFDWRILNSPINLQVDWSPAYYFGADEGLSVVNTAFSIRYILNRKKVYGSEDKK